MLTTELGDCPGEFISLPDGRVVFLKWYTPAAIVARVSHDEGRTWNGPIYLVRQIEGENSGVYPSSMVMDDGTILTISSTHEGTPLQAIRWKLPPL